MKRNVTGAILLLLTLGCAGNIDPARQNEDAVIAANVREALRNEPMLASYDFHIDVASGAVTITGVVRSAAERDRATAVASSVTGVTSVRNILSVQ